MVVMVLITPDHNRFGLFWHMKLLAQSAWSGVLAWTRDAVLKSVFGSSPLAKLQSSSVHITEQFSRDLPLGAS